MPSYKGLLPGSAKATGAARGSSAKRDTKPELLLRRALWARGVRYRVDFAELPGRPDIVVLRARIAIFCDGDFWHGRDLARRLAKLERGHNPRYWVEKIKSNYDRDRRNEGSLRSAGWLVLRFWETDVLEDPFKAAEAVANAIRGRTRTALPE